MSELLSNPDESGAIYLYCDILDSIFDDDFIQDFNKVSNREIIYRGATFNTTTLPLELYKILGNYYDSYEISINSACFDKSPEKTELSSFSFQSADRPNIITIDNGGYYERLLSINHNQLFSKNHRLLDKSVMSIIAGTSELPDSLNYEAVADLIETQSPESDKYTIFNYYHDNKETQIRLLESETVDKSIVAVEISVFADDGTGCKQGLKLQLSHNNGQNNTTQAGQFIVIKDNAKWILNLATINSVNNSQILVEPTKPIIDELRSELELAYAAAFGYPLSS